MKIERLLLGLFASFLMVGCSQNDDLPNGGEEKGDVKDSYLAVNIVAKTNASRAATAGNFEYGTALENKVNTAHFFFFNSDGTAYTLDTSASGAYEVKGTEAETNNTINGTAKQNWLYFSSFVDAQGKTGTPVDNIEKVLSAVLIFKGVSNDTPAKVVVALNLDNNKVNNRTSGLSITDLAKILVNDEEAFKVTTSTDASGNTVDTGNFVMSNSVYMDNESNVVNFTDITNQSKADVTAALNAPVDIYVERLAAKVTVNVATQLAEGNELMSNEADILKVPEIVFSDNTPVYVKILGWDLNTTINKSFTLKDITNAATSWESTAAQWNDANNYRSYWVGNIPTTTNATNLKYNTGFYWQGLNNTLKGVDYCLENNNTSTTTKIVVKAQLVGEDKKPITVAQWMGGYYVGKSGDNTTANWENMLKDIATTLNLWKKSGETYTQIAGTDIKFEPIYGTQESPNENAHDYYKVKFVIASTDATWYKKDASGNISSTALTSDEVTATMNGIVPAKMWQDGATYYFTNIEHFNGKAAVIRNHHYVVNITGVKGLGTPVYYPDSFTPTPENPTPEIPEIPEPVVPSDDETYLSAKINVLSWKLVNNSVVLGQ